MITSAAHLWQFDELLFASNPCRYEKRDHPARLGIAGLHAVAGVGSIIYLVVSAALEDMKGDDVRAGPRTTLRPARVGQLPGMVFAARW